GDEPVGGARHGLRVSGDWGAVARPGQSARATRADSWCRPRRRDLHATRAHRRQVRRRGAAGLAATRHRPATLRPGGAGPRAARRDPCGTAWVSALQRGTIRPDRGGAGAATCASFGTLTW